MARDVTAVTSNLIVSHETSSETLLCIAEVVVDF
jgi:hypothetical protein